MRNHDFETIHENKLGYIAQCPDCGSFMLVIGHIVHMLHLDELKAFHRGVNKIQRALVTNKINTIEYPLHNGRTILLKSPADNMMISFYRHEISLLIDLLQSAIIIEEAHDILDHHHPSA